MDVGLVFTRDLSKDEWKSLGAGLCGLGRAWLWSLGDWICYGERFASVTGEERKKDKDDKKRLGRGVAVECAKITGYSPGFISDVKGVCQSVPIQLRHPLFTVHHAREFFQAKIPDGQLPFWAHRVLTEQLSTREMRIELRKSLRTESPSPSTTRPKLFAQQHIEFVRKFMTESESWTEAEWQAHASWHEPILKIFRWGGL